MNDQEINTLRAERDYLRWKLEQVMPLFQEARDALPAIQVHQARIHNISLSLADRMDVAGTAMMKDYLKTLPQVC